MASDGRLLETLVVRGKHARGRVGELREIAFGLCEVSTRRDSHARLVAKGALTTLHVLLESGDGETARFATLALANVAQLEAARPALGVMLPLFVGLIGGAAADPEARGFAAMAVGNIAASGEYHDAIVAAGGVAALVVLVGSAPPDIARWAAFALGNMSSNVRIRPLMEAAGAIVPLVRLTSTPGVGYADVQLAALTALRGFAMTVAYRARIVEAGVAPHLAALFGSPDARIRGEVGAALACLSGGAPEQEAVAAASLDTVLRVAAGGGDAVDLRHAACILANVLEARPVHARFLEADGLGPLVALAYSDDVATCGAACRGLAHLSANAAAQAPIMAEAGLSPLVAAVARDDAACKTYGALAIANLASVCAEYQVRRAPAVVVAPADEVQRRLLCLTMWCVVIHNLNVVAHTCRCALSRRELFLCSRI
jgi:hypothetical protein